MKRRDFVKMLGALPFMGLLKPKGILTKKSELPTLSGDHSKPSSSSYKRIEPEYPLGTRRVDDCGRVFRYCQVKTNDFVEKDGQIIGIGTGDGWMQTYGLCRNFGEKMSVMGKQLVHLNINV